MNLNSSLNIISMISIRQRPSSLLTRLCYQVNSKNKHLLIMPLSLRLRVRIDINHDICPGLCASAALRWIVGESHEVRICVMMSPASVSEVMDRDEWVGRRGESEGPMNDSIAMSIALVRSSRVWGRSERR